MPRPPLMEEALGVLVNVRPIAKMWEAHDEEENCGWPHCKGGDG
jgi:hypothetical protein